MKRSRRKAAGLALALAAVLFAAPANAGGHAARLTIDNDQFNFWEAPAARPDFGYTHGAELRIHFPEAPHALGNHAPAWLLGKAGEELAFEFLLRQSIYSPWSLPPDRPYAGWLEAGFGLSRSGEQGTHERLIHVGVTGPPSLGGATQRYFHHRFDHGGEPDWQDQLPFEPGFGTEASDLWWLGTTGAPQGLSGRVGAFTRFRLATYAVDARIGVAATVGLGATGGWPAAAHGPSLYVQFAPRVDLIARDEFLDGTLFRDSDGPGSRHVVPESEATVGAGWSHARFEWTVYRRAKEFDQQPSPHTYGALSFTWLP